MRDGIEAASALRGRRDAGRWRHRHDWHWGLLRAVPGRHLDDAPPLETRPWGVVEFAVRTLTATASASAAPRCFRVNQPRSAALSSASPLSRPRHCAVVATCSLQLSALQRRLRRSLGRLSTSLQHQYSSDGGGQRAPEGRYRASPMWRKPARAADGIKLGWPRWRRCASTLPVVPWRPRALLVGERCRHGKPTASSSRTPTTARPSSGAGRHLASGLAANRCNAPALVCGAVRHR